MPSKANNMTLLLKLLPAVALCCALISCKPVPSERGTAVKHDSTGLVIGNPFEYGTPFTMIFPVGCNYDPSIYDNPEVAQEYITSNTSNMGFVMNGAATQMDVSASREYINYNEAYFDLRNILFYNQKTGKTHPLVHDTIHILSFAIHYDFKRPQIFYRVVKKDINNDSMYNSKDPIILYTSNMYGDSLTQLTPDGEQFTQYFYYADTQTMLVKTNLNPDSDTSFATVAETNFREVNLNEPAMGREIFSKSMRDSLRVN